MERFDYLIVGGGAAGMAAALAACEKGASVLLAERNAYLGGILPQCIHSGFGLGYFGEDLTGPQYAARFRSRIEHAGLTVRLSATVLRLTNEKTALLSGRDGVAEIAFEKCILCTGSRERTIGSLPVCGTRPAGIFTAGTAQRLINLVGCDIGNRVLILGSGDIGQIMARRFRLLGKEVVALVEQRAELGGLPRNRKACLEAFQIPVILNATVREIHGTGRICGVTLYHSDSHQTEYLACDTLITAIGLIPERELIVGLNDPDWLRCCGNCDRIYDIVDSLSVQAEALLKSF